MNLPNLKNILIEWRSGDEPSCFDAKWVTKLNTKYLLKFGKDKIYIALKN